MWRVERRWYSLTAHARETDVTPTKAVAAPNSRCRDAAHWATRRGAQVSNGDWRCWRVACAQACVRRGVRGRSNKGMRPRGRVRHRNMEHATVNHFPHRTRRNIAPHSFSCIALERLISFGAGAQINSATAQCQAHHHELFVSLECQR